MYLQQRKTSQRSDLTRRSSRTMAGQKKKIWNTKTPTMAKAAVMQNADMAGRSMLAPTAKARKSVREVSVMDGPTSLVASTSLFSMFLSLNKKGSARE